MARVEEPGARAPAPEPLRLVQELVNTVDLEPGEESLGSPAELGAWLRGHGLPARGVGAADLAEVLALREALREVCAAHAGATVPGDALGTLDRLLRAAPLRLEIDAEGAARVRPADGLGPTAALTAAVAAAVAASVADGTWTRLKACAADTCRWVYYDRSPAGRSRWCTMALCGSRAKMRTYRRNRAGA